MRMVVFCLLMLAHGFAVASDLDVMMHSSVQYDGQSAEIKLLSHDQDDIHCELGVSVSVVRGEFNQYVHSFDYFFRNIYLENDKPMVIPSLASNDLKRLSDSGERVRIFKVTPSLTACRKATFDDYCSKSKIAGEDLTLINALKRTFHTDSCESISDLMPDHLALRNSGIKSLKAIGFFKQIKWLDLQGNEIDDLSSLASLRDLQYLNVSDNPLRNVDPVLELPFLQRLDARSTSLETSLFLSDSSLVLGTNLKRVCVSSTPLSVSGVKLSKPFSLYCW